MLVLGVNKILNWVQITTGRGTYTCSMKEVDGELLFRFKNQWHKVFDYLSDHADELVCEGGKVFSRHIKK